MSGWMGCAQRDSPRCGQGSDPDRPRDRTVTWHGCEIPVQRSEERQQKERGRTAAVHPPFTLLGRTVTSLSKPVLHTDASSGDIVTPSLGRTAALTGYLVAAALKLSACGSSTSTKPAAGSSAAGSAK